MKKGAETTEIVQKIGWFPMLKKMLKSYDFSLIITYFLLCLFGLMMIYSASIVIAIQHYEVDSAFFYNKQKLHLFAAFFLFIAAAIFPYKAYKSNKFLVSILLITIASLLAIFTLGMFLIMRGAGLKLVRECFSRQNLQS